MRKRILELRGLPLQKIGEERTYKLAHKPGSYFVKEFIRPKYANSNKEEQEVFCAELPTTIFPKSKADDSLLAEVLVKKYRAYVTLSKNGDIIWMPCWAHIRRYFFEVESGDLDFCNWILRQIRYLYMLERVAWSRSQEERIKIRQEKEGPIIDLLIKKIKERAIKGDYLPKSKFSKALNYFIGLIPHLKNYTNHEFTRIDNNVAERAVRPLAIGRKNWLFFGSLEAGHHASVIISIIQTCRGLNINPREYLEDIFKRLPDYNAKKVYELLPDQWLSNRQKSK